MHPQGAQPLDPFCLRRMQKQRFCKWGSKGMSTAKSKAAAQPSSRREDA